ncbi:MAG TPA: hypothetical protein PLX35_17415 [Cyclobacteriaceae bacterium]|nr:hypothetical protein [Cyclobacteriaceae bacterium]
MKISDVTIPAILLALLLSSMEIHGSAIDSVDYLVEKNLEAMGGKKNLERINTIIRIRGSANMVTITRLKPSYGSLIVLIDTVLWKMKFSEGRNDFYAWEQGSNDSSRKKIVGRPDSALWASGQNPTGLRLPLYRSRSAGHKVEYVGREKIESINYFKILVTLSRGQQSFYYINPFSFQIERNRGVRRHHAYEEKIREIETVWKDFRNVNGVVIPFIEIEQDITTGERLSGGRPSVDISFNLPVRDEDFTTEGKPDQWINYLKEFLGNRKRTK